MMQIIIATLPTFLLILFGLFIKTQNFLADSFWSEAEKLTYYVLFPALLIGHLARTDFSSVNMAGAIVATLLGTVVIAILVFVSRALIVYQNETFTSIFQGSVRYNSYIFLALTEVLYGQQGIRFAAIVITYMIIFTNLSSVLVLSLYGTGGKSIKNILLSIVKNPLIVSALVGVMLSISQIKLGLTVSTFLDYLGRAALPTSLLCVGAGLRFRMGRHRWAAVISSSLIKLLGVPLATAWFLGLFNVVGPLRSVCLLYAALPCAGNSYILARQMGGDAEAMASIITLTTLLSLVTMALVLSFL